MSKNPIKKRNYLEVDTVVQLKMFINKKLQ